MKDYETIEKATDSLISILIKRFKLRVSLVKKGDFSSDIVICDEYHIDPCCLNNADSLIKIAIVKDNFNQWLDSKNLTHYDYIFTSKDCSIKLNEFDNVFIMSGETIYEQIKSILNELYNMKVNMFYLFIKEIGFLDIFPKWRHYFRILNSEYFNDQWYRDTYEIVDNTDTVLHFLLVGNDKGYNPGPDFSTEEYYQCNEDVESKRINSLVHYELTGREEGRLRGISDRIERDKSIISNSPFFDEDWYRHTYDLDVADAAEHYLNVGFTKGYNPGPDFSTDEYYQCNEDVESEGMNPLVHYELSGREEGRLRGISDRIERDKSIISNSPFFDEDWYRHTYDLDVADAAEHYLNVGFTKGYNPGPDFRTFEYYQCNKDVVKEDENPLLHYELYGRNQNLPFKFPEEIYQDFYDAILNSPLFDEDWYRHAYDLDVFDAVDHYLNLGNDKGYNPGPDFNTNEYYQCNEDVKINKMNSLAHYELYGRKEGRPLNVLDKK